ncbi:hypothetical protein OIU74_013252, partial [Salix koriyanagi]
MGWAQFQPDSELTSLWKRQEEEEEEEDLVFFVLFFFLGSKLKVLILNSLVHTLLYKTAPAFFPTSISKQFL